MFCSSPRRSADRNSYPILKLIEHFYFLRTEPVVSFLLLTNNQILVSNAIYTCDYFEQIKRTNCLVGNADSSRKISVDGTDFSICEPNPLDAKWFSHKVKGPGLRYEVALCISTGYIVWMHGRFPCG